MTDQMTHECLYVQPIDCAICWTEMLRLHACIGIIDDFMTFELWAYEVHRSAQSTLNWSPHHNRQQMVQTRITWLFICWLLSVLLAFNMWPSASKKAEPAAFQMPLQTVDVDDAPNIATTECRMFSIAMYHSFGVNMMNKTMITRNK